MFEKLSSSFYVSKKYYFSSKKKSDQVLIEFGNGNFKGTIKQTAGFGSGTELGVISVVFPNKTKGKKVSIDSILDKV